MTSKDVHIVYNPNKGDVISRLMVSLSEATGWSISKTPRNNADINYFGLYVQVAQGMNRLPDTKIGAWFSHYEIQTPKKLDWWQVAAARVDYRLTTSAQYLPMLEQFGESHIVIPPIDPQFQNKTSGRKVIGVSGYVHPGGRKGEQLVSELMSDQEFKNQWELKGSGKGWGIKNLKFYNWEDMPDFFRSLDVYLCTSMTEGVPMPPLEALASGIPVVVPRGVGLLDQLPSDHVFRYNAGNYEDMIRALKDALYPDLKIRSVFNSENWAKTHQIAFGLNTEDVVPLIDTKNSPVIALPSQSNKTYDVPNCGAIIVAYGAPARECAIVALKSWQDKMSGYPIALVSDFPLGYEDIFIEHPDTDIGARSVKTKLYDIAPAAWDRVLYLDADTEIVNDISILFKWLESFEFLICTNPVYYKSLEQGRRPDNGDETDVTVQELGTGDIIQPNGGVFGFSRNKNTKRFFSEWFSEWNRWGKRDQQALLRSMKNVPLRWLLLNNIWNTVTRYSEPPIEESGGILHHVMNARRWTGIIDGRLDSSNAWKSVEKWKSNQ